MVASESYLPNDCWECVFKFLDNGNYNNNYLKPLSLVSKQFLSITNSLRSTLAIFERNPTILFHRFSNVTCLDLKFYSGDLDILLHEISRFPLKLTSLKLFNGRTIPASGLRAFSQNITTLTSLKCYRFDSLRSSDLFLISDCFPLLEELDLGLGKPAQFKDRRNLNFLNAIKFLSLTLFKLRKINLTGHEYINDQCLFHLFKNCKLLKEAKISNCILVGSNALIDFGVRPQLKSLELDCCSWLSDERIIMFASFFPNLQRLDLSNCNGISDEGICRVLRRCCKIRYLNLASCSRVKLHRMNFEFPTLEVLNLSYTKVDDITLYVISKCCRGLLKLLLEDCYYVTEKGVKLVVKNCTQLREINFEYCRNVKSSVVESTSSSLKKLTDQVVDMKLV
ncbi:unnamed protein product [Trifolium pratense]|uniref:Uncharacterized protein n=1 Tax=Trifolium pratense TaxID=57577 RepID=A0ACB0KGM4_TRIPR|nr:unnamed protein product [Trifolium pratense]